MIVCVESGKSCGKDLAYLLQLLCGKMEWFDIWTEPFGQMFPTAQKQKKKKTKQTNKEKILQQLDEHVLL